MTIISLLLWIYGLWNSNLTIDNYGLISSYNIVFFFSLAVLTIAAALLWIDNTENSKLLLFIQFSLLVISLYLSPLFLEGLPRFRSTYQNYAYIDYILQNGVLNPNVVWYHNWPGFSIFFASFFQITGIDAPFFTMAIFPPVIIIIVALLILLLAKYLTNVRSPQWLWCAAWVFAIANWTSQEYFSPQAIAYILLLCLLIMIIRSFITGDKRLSNKILIIIFMAALTITHAATSFIALIMVAALYIIWPRRLPIMALLFLVAVGAWTIYGAISIMEQRLARYALEAFNMDAFIYATFNIRFIASSQEHTFINYLRVLITFIFLLIAIAGFMAMPKNTRISRQNMSIAVIGMTPVLFIPLFIYGGEFIIRVYLFMLIPIAIFTMQLLNRRLLRVLLIGLLIFLIPLHMLTHYGNEVYEVVSYSEIQVTDFFYSATSDGVIYALIPPELFEGLGIYTFRLTFVPSADSRSWDSLDNIRYRNDRNKNQFVAIPKNLFAIYKYFTNDDTKIKDLYKWIQESSSYHLIYTSPNMKLFAWRD